MNGKQNTVMWLGILLIFTRLFTTGQWSSIWKTLSTTVAPAGTAATTPPGQKPNCSGLPSGSPGYKICMGQSLI